MAKTVDRPNFPEFADTDYITQSRDVQNKAYDYLGTALDNFNNFNNFDQYQAVADAYTQAQWNDLNRGYQQAINQNAARERNRLGTYGASSSLYNTNTLQNTYDDLASRLAANTANQFQNLVNNEYQRRLNTLDANSQLWSGTGATNYQHDLRNYQTKIQNMYNDWLDDVDAHNNNWWNTATDVIGGAVSGASSGFAMGGPIGAIVGGVGGALGGTGTGYTPTNGTSSGMSNLNMNNVGNLIGNLRGLFGNNNTNNYQTYANNQDWLANNTQSYGLNTRNLQDILPNGGRFSWQQ